MVKRPKKPQGITNTPQNSLNQTSKLDIKISKNQEQAERISPKSRQQIYQENYQKKRTIKRIKKGKRLSRRKDITGRKNKPKTKPKKTYLNITEPKQLRS